MQQEFIIKNWAIETTKKANWEKNRYYHFLQKSDQQEFLQSQVPFFYAVQAFPRMLCKLGMLIEDSQERLLVVTNIYEEHGHGKTLGFHTQTYKTYLKALGWNEEFKHNPWVDLWIKHVLSLALNKESFAAYLSGIEYLYALISQDITQHISKLKLSCEQEHYKNHSILDWEHGYELLSVALSLSENNELTEEMKEVFIQAQQDFLEMYGHLSIPTKKEMEEIHQEKIAFYYIREDSKIESNVLASLPHKDEKIDILSIASGGEHIFEYLIQPRHSNIDVIDININQLELSKKKLNSLLTTIDEDLFDENNIGKFEKLFMLFTSYFNEEEINHLINDCSTNQQKLKFIVDVLFSNDYLNIVFGEEATKYTKKSFSEHFYQLFKNRLVAQEKNTMNVFKKTRVRDYDKLSEQLKLNHDKHTINWSIVNPKDVEFEKKYDMINISNIGDWMSLEDYQSMIKRLYENTKPQGCIIARKLLGDYQLKDIFEAIGFKCVEKEDTTHFYSEVILAYRE